MRSTRASSSDVGTTSVSNRHGGGGGSRSAFPEGSISSSSSASSSCSAGGGALLKRTCSSLSLLSDITLAAALCADGVGNADLLAADDEVEPPDDGSYSPDFSGAERSASSSAVELLGHLNISAAELRLSSSAPNTSERRRQRQQSQFRRRLLAKLKRHRKSPAAEAAAASNHPRRRRRSANAASLSSFSSSSRSSSPSSASSSSRDFAAAAPAKPQRHATWPVRQGTGLVDDGHSSGSPRGTARSSTKGPFSRVRKLLRKKNRSLDLSRDARAGSGRRRSGEFSANSSASLSLDSASPENSHAAPRRFQHQAHHQFTHMCTHCGRTHTLRATLTTTLTSARAHHHGSSASASPRESSRLAPVALRRAQSAPVRSLRDTSADAEAGSPSPNPDERDVIALSTADDPLSGTTQYCCKKSSADSDLFPIQEGKLMLTRNPSDAFPSSYKLQLRCSHFEESLLHQWFEIDHYDPDTQDDEFGVGGFGGGSGSGANGAATHHTDVCEHCSAACTLCSDELSSSHSSSSSAGSTTAASPSPSSSAPFLLGSGSGSGALGGFAARPDYVYTLDENFSFERVRVSA